MINNGIQVLIELDNGTTCTEYNRDRNTYIEGRKGSTYNIRVINNNYFRVGVVVSVDGLNVIDGKLASDKSQQYLIGRYQTIIIKGFRISDKEVRRFEFSSKESSYSNKTGNGVDNSGVIGVVAFQEKIARIHHVVQDSSLIWMDLVTRKDTVPRRIQVGSPYQPQNINYLSLSQINASYAATASHVLTQLGTAMRDKVQSEVTYLEFTHEDKSLTRMVIFYNTRKELEKMGLIVKKISNPTKIPNPFPGNYCKEV